MGDVGVRVKGTRFCMSRRVLICAVSQLLTFRFSSLKLQVYRSLGIDVSQDANTGVFNRAVIRNPVKGDVNVVKVDGKVDKSVYANMFWDSL